MSAWSSIPLAATFIAAWTAGVAAQDSIPLGARVRLRLNAPHVSASVLDTHTVVVKGRAVAVDGGTLRVARESPRDTVSVPLAAILRLERQVRESHEVRGALIGGAVGATLGLAVGIAAANEEGRIRCADYRGELPCIEPLPFVPLCFAAAGALVGGRLGRGRWQRLAVPAVRATSTASPVVTFTVGLRF